MTRARSHFRLPFVESWKHKSTASTGRQKLSVYTVYGWPIAYAKNSGSKKRSTFSQPFSQSSTQPYFGSKRTDGTEMMVFCWKSFGLASQWFSLKSPSCRNASPSSQENGRQRASGWMVFRTLGVQLNLEYKSSFRWRVFTQGDNSDWEVGSLFRRSSIQLSFFNNLFCGPSVLVEKRFSMRRLIFPRVLSLFQNPVQSSGRRIKKSVSITISFESLCPCGQVPV